MDETLKQQAKLIRSQINILSIMPVQYDQGSAAYADKQYRATKYMVTYEFPYRVNGERYWSKQVYTSSNGYINGEVYKDICNKVTELRKILEN